MSDDLDIVDKSESVAPTAPNMRDPASRVSAFVSRHRRVIAGVWIALLIACAPLAASIMAVLSGGGWMVDGSQSKQAAEVLSQADLLGRGKLTVVLVVRDLDNTIADPKFEDRVRQTVDFATAVPDLKVDSTYGWSTLDRGDRDRFLGADQRSVIDSLAIDLDVGAARRVLPDVQDQLTAAFAGQRLDVSLVSQDAMFGTLNEASQKGLILAEIISIPLIAFILIMLYRSVAAVAASLAVGVTTIALTLGILSPIAHAFDMSIFMANAATMLGLGVGVDYSLFVISRFQEELARGRAVDEAVTIALRRSGHTVIFSGITVIATTAMLLMIKLDIVISLAIGAITGVAMSMLVCTLLLPTLLHILGHRINWGRPRFLKPRSVSGGAGVSTGRWRTFALTVMHRPIVFGLLGIAFMGVLSYPALSLKTATPDVSVLAANEPTRRGFDTIAEQFGPGAPSPVRVVVSSNESMIDDATAGATYIRLVDKLTSLTHVDRVLSHIDVARQLSPDVISTMRSYASGGLSDDVRQSIQYFLSADGKTGLIELWPDSSAAGDGAHAVVDAAQTAVAAPDFAQLSAVVGGETAEGQDANAVIADKLPTVIIATLIVVFLVLLFTFRSLLLPLKAIVMNLLSLGATFGIMVAVFQNGFLTGLLGFDHIGYMQNFVPVLMLAILISLSTDYEVFLLNRVRESYVRTGNNSEAVAEGLEATGPLISGAAVLMVAVFGAFAFTGVVPIQQLGFGMAVGVLLDATVVRLILVPAAMRLMGKWNWWFPGRRFAASSP